jgi:hypothetical protein
MSWKLLVSVTDINHCVLPPTNPPSATVRVGAAPRREQWALFTQFEQGDIRHLSILVKRSALILPQISLSGGQFKPRVRQAKIGRTRLCSLSPG